MRNNIEHDLENSIRSIARTSLLKTTQEESIAPFVLSKIKERKESQRRIKKENITLRLSIIFFAVIIALYVSINQNLIHFNLEYFDLKQILSSLLRYDFIALISIFLILTFGLFLAMPREKSKDLRIL